MKTTLCGAIAVLATMLATGTAHADNMDSAFLSQAGLSMASDDWQIDGITMGHQMCYGFSGGGLTAADARDIGTRRFGQFVGDRIARAAVDNYCPFNAPADLGPRMPATGSAG